MRLPITEEGNPKSIDQTLVNKMVDYFLEKGFTYFDTAFPYHKGMSEVAAKKALVERYPRDSFVLADKMPTFLVTCSDDYQTLFDKQLQRCGVSYFDYYLLHTLGEKNYANTLQHGGFDFMKKLKAEGKAKHIGFSFHDKAELLDEILTQHPEMEFVQLQINYVDLDDAMIQSRKCHAVAVKHQKPIIVMEPVKGGALDKVPEAADQLLKRCHPDWSPASWAIRFAASLDNVFMVLSGMGSFEQMVDNTGYMQNFEPLNAAEIQILEQVAEIIKNNIAIPCTACQYCVDGCPSNIPIPKYFALFNNQHQFGLVPSYRTYYMNMIQTYGKAADCIGCGQCEQHCPQHIEIIEQLKEVSRIFDAD